MRTSREIQFVTVASRLPLLYPLDVRFGVKAMPGVHKMLEALEFPFCVASNGSPKKIKKALSVSALDSFFGDKIYSSYEVGSWKPEPRLFLHAAESMGYNPKSCAVVEDSPPGIQAAIAANMKPFRYFPHERLREEQGVVTFGDMIKLPSLLEESKYNQTRQ